MEEIMNTEVAESATTETTETARTFTQEEVNGLIKERLDRAEKKWAEKYAGYMSGEDLESRTDELNKQIAELGNSLKVATEKATADAKSIEALETKLKNNETDSAKIRIALEMGIPYELADRLTGSTEDEIRADAQKLAPMLSPRTTMPLHNPDAAAVDGVMAKFMELNPNIKL